MSRPQRRLMEGGAPVFTYHKIGAPPKETRDPFLYASAENFDSQLHELATAGFRPARLDEIVAPKNSGNIAAVTFDDGFQSALENGLEILARNKTTAIQFIVADFIGKRNEWDVQKGDVAEPLMDAAQLKEWLAAGHEIGSHSATHRNLKKLGPAEVREELFGGKKKLEDKLGIEVRHFCYPFGGLNPQLKDLVEEAGYSTACTVEFGVNGAAVDRFALRRIIPLSSGELIRKIIHRLIQRVNRV
jgi:peptidoglycan/xylan/chitin deacetylase (PgdA/CDA1 family)